MTLTDYDPSFEKLWGAYPKRNGRKVKKSPAYKKWLTLDSGQKAALKASVDKHNREQSWGKYIRDLVTYINQAGWEDEVDDPVKAGTPAYHLAPQPQHDCTKWQALANRWLFKWLHAGGGLPDDLLPIGIKVKNAATAEMAAALDEDLARDASVESQTEAVWTFVNVLVDRLDAEFGKNLKPLLLKGAST